MIHFYGEDYEIRQGFFVAEMGPQAYERKRKTFWRRWYYDFWKLKNPVFLVDDYSMKKYIVKDAHTGQHYHLHPKRIIRNYVSAFQNLFEQTWRIKNPVIIRGDIDETIVRLTLGLGEMGEAQDKIRKILRDKKGVLDYEATQEILKELADGFYFGAGLATVLGSSVGDVFYLMFEKLVDRYHRGVIRGSGDNR